jgi:hypothetical protein
LLTAVVTKGSMILDITSWSSLKVNRHFGGICGLHIQSRIISQAKNQCGSRWQLATLISRIIRWEIGGQGTVLHMLKFADIKKKTGSMMMSLSTSKSVSTPLREKIWNKNFTVNNVMYFLLLSLVGWDSPLCTSATTGLLNQPQMIDDGDCGAIAGMKIGRGNWSTRRKPASVPLCPPQILHDLTWARTRAAAVGSQRLTAWAMTRPCQLCKKYEETIGYLT